MKRVPYKKRLDRKVCPVCGYRKFKFLNHHVEYPEIWTELYCENCKCTLEYQDNCLPQNIWDFIKEAKIMSKRRVLDKIRKFYPSNKNIKHIK